MEAVDYWTVQRLVERIADSDGQLLLEPAYELEGWWRCMTKQPSMPTDATRVGPSRHVMVDLGGIGDQKNSRWR
ncbi:hypothetical protein ELY33_06700 [Vreelandella andesensis]|uniref:Uncharacterized protein n=1 Tax=Vreelandella andesensis TaxID=447567 RepID=A0A3S0W906_9GAMM|nr:hypothetical protein [Halomonas andesensis]RUR32097.1 hypothetical protein ELY33_06700 [Halomonas andesensis]